MKTTQAILETFDNKHHVDYHILSSFFSKSYWLLVVRYIYLLNYLLTTEDLEQLEKTYIFSCPTYIGCFSNPIRHCGSFEVCHLSRLDNSSHRFHILPAGVFSGGKW